MKKNTGKAFEKLVRIMKRLHSPGGCPWDRRQTHASLIKYLHEETGEMAEAVKNKDWENLKEELGDVLLQVVFHARLAEARGRFGINEVIDGINEKLVRRHPHVFGGRKLKTSRQVLRQWNEIKRKEKEN